MWFNSSRRLVWHSACDPKSCNSEGPSAVEKNEDHRRTGHSDQRKGGEVGNQVDIEAHGVEARSDVCHRLRLPHPPEPEPWFAL